MVGEFVEGVDSFLEDGYFGVVDGDELLDGFECSFEVLLAFIVLSAFLF